MTRPTTVASDVNQDTWRHTCPDCRSVMLRRRVNYGKDTVRGAIEPGGPFYCDCCKQSIERVYDKKTDEVKKVIA